MLTVRNLVQELGLPVHAGEDGLDLPVRWVHISTLRYRIRRIESLTGRSLQNARDRIEFWLALRGRELVREPQAT